MKTITAILLFVCAVFCAGDVRADELTLRSKGNILISTFGKYCESNNIFVQCDKLNGENFQEAISCPFKDGIDRSQLLADLRQYCGASGESKTTTTTSGTSTKVVYLSVREGAAQTVPKNVSVFRYSSGACSGMGSGAYSIKLDKNGNGTITVSTGVSKVCVYGDGYTPKTGNIEQIKENNGKYTMSVVMYKTDGETSSQSNADSKKNQKAEDKKKECADKGKVAKQDKLGIWSCVDSEETKAQTQALKDYKADINKIYAEYQKKYNQIKKKTK